MKHFKNLFSPNHLGYNILTSLREDIQQKMALTVHSTVKISFLGRHWKLSRGAQGEGLKGAADKLKDFLFAEGVFLCLLYEPCCCFRD